MQTVCQEAVAKGRRDATIDLYEMPSGIEDKGTLRRCERIFRRSKQADSHRTECGPQAQYLRSHFAVSFAKMSEFSSFTLADFQNIEAGLPKSVGAPKTQEDMDRPERGLVMELR